MRCDRVIQSLNNSSQISAANDSSDHQNKNKVLYRPEINSFTLVQLILFDSAWSIGIKRLKDCLPLIYIIIKLLELVQINRARRVLVEKVWNETKKKRMLNDLSFDSYLATVLRIRCIPIGPCLCSRTGSSTGWCSWTGPRIRKYRLSRCGFCQTCLCTAKQMKTKAQNNVRCKENYL